MCRRIHSVDRLRLRDASRPGQSLVEFALVLPMLLIFLLAVADFGRVFSAGIIVESAARNGAEAAAQELVQLRRAAEANGTDLSSDEFQRLHDVAREAVCDEAEKLPEVTVSGGTCSQPWSATCVHNDSASDPTPDVFSRADPLCGSESAGAAAACDEIQPGWGSGAVATSGGLPLVEVRVCYQFNTLFDLSGISLPFGWSIPLGDAYIERTRFFVAGDY